MTSVLSISEQLERQSVQLVESTIPGDLTIEEWRRHPRRQVPRTQPCGHLHDTTTRYDHDRKLLHFLLVCPVCGTETVIETQPYEPRFTHSAPGGGTIHQLPGRRDEPPLRHAA